MREDITMNYQEGLAAVKELLGERASDAAVRRFSYGHDMGTLPDVVVKLLKNVPDLVIQPETEEELVEVVKIAAQAGIPLTPRGSASGGYGGAVAADAGIMVDMYRMSNIIGIDADASTVTVQPAAIICDVDEALRAHGLQMPFYTTSSLSATIGGCVAQGASGIGSNGQGSMRDNLVSVRMVLGDASVRELEGDELDLVYAMEGITGIISQVTLRVVPAMDLQFLALGAASAQSAQAAAKALMDAGVWHVNMQPPNYVALQNRACDNDLPERWVVFAAAPAGALDAVVLPADVETYSDDVARFEWDERYYPLRAKKYGPSIIPVDVLVPVERMAEFADVMKAKYEDSFLYEATAVGGGMMALIGFILADERKADFTMSFANSLVISEVAKKLGGGAYATGLYLQSESEAVFGRELLERVAAFKAQTDGAGIMNPGKVLPPSLDPKSPSKLIAKALGASRGVAGIGAAFARLMAGGKRENVHMSDLPEGTEDSAFACASCGFCRNKCTSFFPDPWEDSSPRGKWYILKEYAKGNLPLDVEAAHRLNICTTCKRCEQVCEVSLKMADHFLGAKPYFKQKGFSNKGLAALRGNMLDKGNFWGSDAAALAWKADDMRFSERGAIGFWPGCWTQTISKNAAQNTVRLLNDAGIEPVDLAGDGEDVCCGFYLFLGGYEQDFEDRVVANIKRINASGVKTVLTPCPACLATFAELYGGVAQKHGLPFDVEFVHSVVFLNDLVRDGSLKLAQGVEQNVKLTYHDPCHLGRWFGAYEQPREFIGAIPGVEYEDMAHNRADSLCCGLVNAFYQISNVPKSGVARVQEADDVNADYICTACAGCGVQINNMCLAAGVKARQVDITDFAARAMGHDVYDANEATQAYFQAAVDLLSDSTTVRD